MKDLVAELLRQGLGMGPAARSETLSASSMVEVGEKGLPVIRCIPDAPATQMNVAELLKFEKATQAEEDSKRAGFAV